MKSEVVLVHPPQAKPSEPAPGVLVLAGHLRKRGVSVGLVDANLILQETLLSSDSLCRCADAIAEIGSTRAHLTSSRRCIRRGPTAWDALLQPGVYRDRIEYRAALDDLSEAYRSVSRARGVRVSLSDLEIPGLSPLASRDLASVAEEPGLLPFERELAVAAEEVLQHDPKVVGISATYLSQALPSFALAGILKRQGYVGQLVLGGGLLTSWANALSSASRMLRVWDAAVVGPGEDCLEALAAGRDVSRFSGVLSPARPEWEIPAGHSSRAVCFSPDPSGLPWERYRAPGPILPLATSRGCYWRRCAFCPEAAQDRQPFRRGEIGALIDSVQKARQQLGAGWVHLTDDAVPPRALRGFAQALRGSGLRWYGFARLEPALADPSLAAELAEGGCAMLQLGVETVSQRLLDRMGKGTRASIAGTILKNLARAGIRTYVYLLFGIPGEEPAEVKATIDWACAKAEDITFLNLALMNRPRERAPDQGAREDLSLYVLPPGADECRRVARSLLAEARVNSVIRQILSRSPAGFTSNHAAFAPL